MSSIERGGLLSRVADTLYLIGRYLERAEHGARLLDVHTNVALDLTDTIPEWRELIALCQDDGGYPANWPIDGHWVARFVVHYEGNRNSILACLSVARENARGVRGAISSELWEQINALHRAARHDVETGSWLTHTHAFLQSVKQGAHLFHGIADETMLHDEGVAFLRLGKNLERAVNTARLVATKAEGLTRPDGEPDLARCAALLKMCSGFEAYRRYYAAPVEPVRVIEFLLLNQTFPRSAHWSVNRAADEGRDLARQGTTGRAPERLLGSLHAQLAYAGPDDLAPERLGDFLARFLSRATEVEHALVDAFFPRDGRSRVVGRQAFAPQQQQQQ